MRTSSNIGNINTDGGGSGSGGSGSGGSGSGGSGSGGSGSGESPINNWKPPLADADYEEAQLPAPASSCATMATQDILWGWVLCAIGFVSRRRKD